MYNIEFYEDSNGKSELWEFLEFLRIKAATNKDARIQYKQISLCFYINFAKKLKKLQNASLIGQRLNATIILPERRLNNYENLE